MQFGFAMGGAVLGALFLTALGLAPRPVDPAPQQPAPVRAAPPRIVLGTFDARAVAIAWARSKEFATYMRALRGDVTRLAEQARAAGDAATAADLEQLGPSLQQRMHEQGFSTAPIDDILAQVADRLPAVAQKAGVDAIVNTWDLVHGRGTATTVDVTDEVVALFGADAETLAVVHQIVGTEPQPRGASHQGH